MTSINALKFNDHSGIMMCDEQRGWNEENMKLMVTDKIKPCVPEEIVRDTGLVAAYGNTGTSSIGDEIKFSIYQKMREEYRKYIDTISGKPKHFKTVDELSELVFNVITKMKKTHIDQELKSTYGFDAVDFLRGYYEKNGKKLDIKDKDIINNVNKLLTWKGRGAEGRSVFLNAGLLAGYDDREGFRIFHFSLIRFFREPVQAIYLADGSGYDMVNLHLSDYTGQKSLPERRGNIEPVEGTMELLSALNKACDRNFGVGGYYTITLFNGKEKNHNKRMKEICDHRAKLASEIMYAHNYDLISQETAYGLIDNLIFNNGTFKDVNKLLFKNCTDQNKLKRLLRGYKN